MRDCYNYTLKDGRRHVYKGITNDPEARLVEHVLDGKRFTHMVIDGTARTRPSAKRREAQALATYRENHGGRNPKYNRTRDG
ncbi:MAG: hypothetical protein ACOZNI_20910 [Myxococcota bacterium]